MQAEAIKILSMESWTGNYKNKNNYKFINNLYNNTRWEKIEIGSEFLNGVTNQKNIKETFEVGDRLEARYKNGNIIYYQNLHGTWHIVQE